MSAPGTGDVARHPEEILHRQRWVCVIGYFGDWIPLDGLPVDGFKPQGTKKSPRTELVGGRPWSLYDL